MALFPLHSFVVRNGEWGNERDEMSVFKKKANLILALDDLMVKGRVWKAKICFGTVMCCANEKKNTKKNVDRMHNTFQYTLSLLSALISFPWLNIRSRLQNLFLLFFSFLLHFYLTWLPRARSMSISVGVCWNDIKISLELHILTTQPLMSFNYFFQKLKMKENDFISLRTLISLRLAI